MPLQPIKARDFSYLLGHLRGISDRMLSAHLEHYHEEVRRLNAMVGVVFDDGQLVDFWKEELERDEAKRD
jgi:hypothetical protein